jgi:hypothetical protein
VANQFVYRVTRTRTRRFGRVTYTERKVTPLATAQRLGCIRAYDRDLPEEERWDTVVERAVIGDWEPFGG